MIQHKDPLLFTFVTLIGNLLPTFILLIIYIADQKGTHDWEGLFDQGQFYLYSASFLTTAAYIFYTFKLSNTDGKSLFCLLSCIFILIISILYVVHILGRNSDRDFLFYSSFGLFFIAILLYYYSNYLSPIKFDVNEYQANAINKIKNEL